MSPYRSFWIAILAYGVLSAASFLPPTDLPSAGGGIVSVLVAASAGYALRRRDRVGGPEQWNLAVLAAIGGAVLYAAVTVVEAI